jgi:hypothetical protein
MSYASRFSSNRFAVLDQDADNDNMNSPTRGAGCAAPAPAVAYQPTADAARVALSSGSDTYRTPNSIFRRGNQSDAGSMPSAFQSMRGGSTADGFTQVGGGGGASQGRRRYEPTPGYKGLFHKEAPPPPPKTYEEEFPSLGGPKRTATAATAPPLPKKSGFADLAKSWAKTTAEEEAAAKAAAEKREQERRRTERDNDLYRNIFNSRLAAAASASASAADSYDYNEEFYRNHPAGAFDEPEDNYPEHEGERSHTPPYPPTDYPGEYEERAQPREDEW